jgi:hypothetical protein
MFVIMVLHAPIILRTHLKIFIRVSHCKQAFNQSIIIAHIVSRRYLDFLFCTACTGDQTIEINSIQGLFGLM